MENNRNYFVAIALSVLILIAWQFLYVNPKIERERTVAEMQAEQDKAKPDAGATAGSATTTSPSGAAVPGATVESREAAVTASPRVAIETDALLGSINLTGARFDDLKLREFHETVDRTSPIITLLSPAETEHGYFAEVGYVGNDTIGQVPGPQTVWTQEGTGKLTVATPVTLTYTNDKGIKFVRTVSVDEHYLFQVTDSIENTTGAPVSLSSYGRITRFSKPTTPSIYVLHEGFISYLGELGLHEVTYSNAEEDTTIEP
ncbi:MAG TPA: membrane protein insertase YidC, partial [Mycoplana sp.]|nr:membrane protein insertase YidC [Mycoplana sp.]